MNRIATLFRKWFDTSDDDAPVDDYLQHSEALETHLNNVAFSLGRLKGNERHLKFELEAAMAKIEVTDKRLATLASDDDVSRDQLALMQARNKKAAVELGRRLEKMEEQRRPIQEAHAEMRALVGDALDQRDILLARLDAANARDAAYGDASGLADASGKSRLESVLDEVRRLEARAEASEELFALESSMGSNGPAMPTDGGGRPR